MSRRGRFGFTVLPAEPGPGEVIAEVPTPPAAKRERAEEVLRDFCRSCRQKFWAGEVFIEVGSDSPAARFHRDCALGRRPPSPPGTAP